MTYRLNDREVDITEVNYDYRTVLVMEAFYLDTEEELNSLELKRIEKKYQDKLLNVIRESMLD